ncbi:MAG: hypothetical protein WD810_06575 [Solirubrobacterales bacterium]
MIALTADEMRTEIERLREAEREARGIVVGTPLTKAFNVARAERQELEAALREIEGGER